MQQEHLHSVIPYVVAILVVVVMMALRLRRMSQLRPLRIEWLWVTPALLIALTVVSMLPQPPQGIAWAYLAAGLALGGALGWWRGRMMHISVDPATRALNTRASPGAMIFIVLIIGLRIALRGVVMGEASALHLSVSVITGVFLAFAIGLLGMQRLEMGLRGGRLLAEARASSGG